MLFLVLVADFFVLVFNRFLFFVLVLDFVNGIVIFFVSGNFHFR